MEITTASDLPNMEILTYDVSDDNMVLYFVGFDQTNNVVVGGKIGLSDKSWSRLDTAKKLTSVRIIK